MFEPKPQTAVAAIRVSTTKQGTEGDSPEAQREQIKRYAETRNIRIKKYFEFLESASKEVQPMQRAVDYCKDPRNRVDLLIVKSIDRFTRGGSYSYSSLKRQLDERGVRLVDLYGIIGTHRVNTLEHLGVSYSWSVYDPTKNSEILEAERASDEKRDIMSRLMGAEIRYTRLGYWMRRAPYGFMTRKVTTMHGRRIVLVPDPTEAPYVIKAFELRARGTMNDDEIANELNNLGFKSRAQFVRSRYDSTKIADNRGGKPMTGKRLYSMITNTLYAGVNCEKWTNGTPVKCRFDGLVSPEVFNRANKGKIIISDDRQSITYKRKGQAVESIVSTKTHNYPYRRVVLCPICMRPYQGSASRGRNGKYYMAYHCSRGGHDYRRIRKAQFEATVDAFVRRVHVAPEHTDRLLEIFAEEWVGRQESYFRDLDRKCELLDETKARIKNIVKSLHFMRSDTALEYIESDLFELETEKRRLEGEIVQAEKDAPPGVAAALSMARQYIDNVDEILLGGTSALAKERLFGMIFNTLPEYTQLLDATHNTSPTGKVNELFIVSSAPE